MAKKQFIAQIGVFLLLGVNVAAYWFLWPNYHSVSSNEGKTPTQEKGATRLVPDAPTKSAPPKEIPPSTLKEAVPLSIPDSVPKQESKFEPDAARLKKLVEQIKTENETLPLTPTAPLDMPPSFPPMDSQKKEADAPKTLPLLPVEPLRSDTANPPVAVASALTPKMLPSPWLLSMEMVGTRTQLRAKVRQPGTVNVVAEFTILCDRVEMKSPGGEVQALGNVTVVGAGMNAACQRLTLPIHETRLVLEEKTQIAHDGVAGSILRGDRVAWELPVAAAPTPPNPFAPPALGLPK